MIGRTLAHYEITEKIGEGGMGEVYRARDPRLGRDVAIKVLREHRIEGADARMRFEREARAVAALSHPNILAIHDVGEHEGVAYAVTELLEGRTLLSLLQEGPLPLRTGLDLAGQMADGLAAAHDRGIVHRDIKPSNLFVTADGRLKILDFGLAKAAIADDDRTIATAAPDATSPGTVLGTVRYMSPEQVRGEAVDHRCDVFSFGTVLWEMLSGRPAFDGDSAVEIMSAILKQDPPDLSSANHSVPAAVDRILHRCLEKAKERRFQSAQDLAFALRNAGDSSSRVLTGLDSPPSSAPVRVRAWGIGAAILLAGVVIGALLANGLRTPEIYEPVQIVNLTHSGQDFAPSASPDGRTIAFVSNRDGRDRIWLRQLTGGVEAPLTEGTDLEPKFSPDGTTILFMRNEGDRYSAYRVAVVGGPARKILDNVSAVCWAPDGRRMAFVRYGGTVDIPVGIVGIHDLQSSSTTELARFEFDYLYGLAWSPDGKWISISSSSAVQNTTDITLYLVDAMTGKIEPLRKAGTRISSASWTPDSSSLIVAESMSLLGDISGAPGRVLRVDLDGKGTQPLFWVQSVWAGTVDYARFDFVDEGLLIFDEVLWRGNLTEISLDGSPPFAQGRTLTQGNSRDRQPAYAPDGSALVFSSSRSGNLDIWSLDRTTGEVRQITDDTADDWDPAFSADGREVLWSSNRGGHLEIWVARRDGSNARQLTRDGVDAENPTQTPDGKWVVYGSANPSYPGIWKIRSDGSEAVHLVQGPLLLPEVSPDGRHVSYVVFDPANTVSTLRVADLEAGEVVFSTDITWRGYQSLIQPGRSRWLPDGRALVFVAPDDADAGALFVQDFVPHQDTSASRRLLVAFESGQGLESFGISPDGRSVTVSRVDHFRSLKLARGVDLGRK